MTIFKGLVGFRSIAACGLLVAYSATYSQTFSSPAPLPKNFGFEQKLGVQLPLDTPFKDENGKVVVLGDFYKTKPVILAMIFYHCNGSCLLVRDGIIKTANAQKLLEVERDFDVVLISIHPKETPELAKSKKALWLKDYKYPDTEKGWHFLTGTWDDIHKVTDKIGFQYTFDEATDRVAHAAGIVICTPKGIVSEYLLGVTYAQKEVHEALLRAQENKIGPKTQTILWGCLQYDPKTGAFSVKVVRLLQILGSITLLILVASIVTMSVKHKYKPLTSVNDIVSDLEGPN